MDKLRPNNVRASWAIKLIGIVLIFNVTLLISEFFQYQLLQSAVDGTFISEEQAENNDTRQQVLGIFYMLAFIISSIAFIQWFRRAYYNLHIKVPHLDNSEGWAAGAWFVPFINLYRPYKIMEELYVETETYLEEKIKDFRAQSSMGVLAGWWTLWIVSHLIGQFVLRYDAVTINELIMSTYASIAQSLIGIPLALLIIKIIKDYSIMENLLYELKEENLAVE